MKIQQHSSNLQQTGDIKNNAVSIDVNNLDFIVTILSTNLYSKPIESFIRETVSNAWDSHVEAGNDNPVVVHLNKDTEGNMYCKIQDFGVGLSPERFDKIYRNIGSSTKRDSNDQIGGFGIGRFSALSYSDTVYITSNYEGREYKYIMYKDGNSVSIDLLFEQDSDAPNGVEVYVNFNSEYDYSYFTDAIRNQLCYFENLYLEDNIEDSFSNRFNGLSIKRYKNFSVNNLLTEKKLSICIGKVRYPLRFDALDKNYPEFVGKLPIALNFNIGDLSVTPNREEILYNPSNKAKIQEVLDATLKEIGGLVQIQLNKDHTNVLEYYNAVNEAYLTLLDKRVKDKEGQNYQEIKFKVPKSYVKPTLNGVAHKAKDFTLIFDIIGEVPCLTRSYRINGGRLKYDPTRLRIKSILCDIQDETSSYTVCDISEVSNITKSYFRDKYDYFSHNFIIPDYSKKVLAREIFKLVNNRKKDRDRQDYRKNERFEYNRDIIKLLIRYFFDVLDKYISEPFTDADVPQRWITEYKASKKRKVSSARIDKTVGINVHYLRYQDRGYGPNRELASDCQELKFENAHKQHRNLVIYAERTSERLRKLYSVIKSSGIANRYTFIEVAKTKMKYLENIDNFIKLEDFMTGKSNSSIKKMATAMYIRETYPYLLKMKDNNLDKINSRLYSLSRIACDYVNKYAPSERLNSDYDSMTNQIYQMCKKHNIFDWETRIYFDQNKKLIEAGRAIALFTDSYRGIEDGQLNVITDYLLARKILRPNYQAVNKLRKETIFNIVENENNDA